MSHGKASEPPAEPEGLRRQLALALSALGIVYGDIGTSPLYAFRQSLTGLEPSADNVLGILSLIFWALVVVVSLKYLVLVMRADNRGEGGILALLALLNPWRGARSDWPKNAASTLTGSTPPIASAASPSFRQRM